MEVSNPVLQPGSIDEISKRLALWARRNPQGLVRVEYSSEFARQRVVQQLTTLLALHHLSVQEISLPSYQPAETLVRFLLEQLAQIAETDPGSVVSITGFATAFSHQEPLPDALRIINFNRERFADVPLKQIWWMTPAMMQTVIHAMPDLNSWFSQRLQLTEAILAPLAIEPSTEPQMISESSTANIEDARHRAYALLQQFEASKGKEASDEKRLTTYLLPALEALAEAGAQKELRDLTGQFEGFLGSLKLKKSPELATTLDRLANLYYEQGRYGEAKPLYEKALTLRETLLGSDHLDVAQSLNSLALLNYAIGCYGNAKALLQRSLSIREQQLGANHSDVATSLNNLAELYRTAGRYSEAEPLYLRSLSILEQQLGINHPHVASNLNNLALLYSAMGRYAEAEPLRLKCLEIEKQTLGENHPQYAASLNNLAVLYQEKGLFSKAEPLYRQSLSIWEHQLGSDHPHVATSLNNLAGLLCSMGQYREAELLCLRALAIQDKTLSTEHPYSRMEYNHFKMIVKAALEVGQTDQLSDHPMTQAILQSLKT